MKDDTLLGDVRKWRPLPSGKHLVAHASLGAAGCCAAPRFGEPGRPFGEPGRPEEEEEEEPSGGEVGRPDARRTTEPLAFGGELDL